jgi:hypothetical protein
MPALTYQYLTQNLSLSADSLKVVETRLLQQMQPLRCWQASVGYDKTLLSAIETKIGLYYKLYDREFPYTPPFSQYFFHYDQSGEIKATEQKSKRKALGLELSVQENHSKNYFYSASMSLFDIKDEYPDGSWHNDWINVGYTFYVSGGLQFCNSHLFSASVQGTGGRPFSPSAVASDCVGTRSMIYTATDFSTVGRLEKLLCANIRYGYTIRFCNRNVESFIEILNLFNSLPTIDYKFDGENLLEVKPFGVTPIIGCTVQL